MQKIIFDLDDTLIPWNDSYLNTIMDVYSELNITYNECLQRKIKGALATYELQYDMYKEEYLLEHFEYYLGTVVHENFVKIWLEKLEKCVSFNDCYQLKEILNTLDYLSKKYSLSILTNFFTKSQTG